MEKVLKKYQNLFFYSFIILFLTVFMFLFVSATNPILYNHYGYDSAYYRYIGASILKGKTPYVDVWESKGPFFYFIQAAGALNGTLNRKISLIFPMQILAMLITVFFLERADFLMNAGKRYRKIRFLVLLVCSLPVYAVTIQGGNLTEDWSLPMISCSLYFFMKYAVKTGCISYSPKVSSQDVRHPRSYAFNHGICFSMIAFIRINNSVSICAGLLVIGLILIINRQWKNLIENVLFGLLGMLVVTLPLFIWYFSKNALNEMLYATFLHGLKYTKIMAHGSFSSEEFFIRYLPLIIGVLLFFIEKINKWRISYLDIIVLVILCANFVMLNIQNFLRHYFIIVFPVFLFALIVYAGKSFVTEFIILSTYFAYMLYYCNDVLYWNFTGNKYPTFPTANMFVPKAERNSMIAIDASPEIYLNMNMEPISRFAAFQAGLFEIEPEFKEEFLVDLKTKNPKWIVKTCDRKIPQAEIQTIIDENYSLRFMDTYYCFYRLDETMQ